MIKRDREIEIEIGSKKERAEMKKRERALTETLPLVKMKMISRVERESGVEVSLHKIIYVLLHVFMLK